jgi:mannose-6-phosphate isomerase-like protein (cupin superfamily)
MQVIDQALLLDGDFEGRTFGSEVSFIIAKTDKAGYGPALHRHPYTETFVIRSGEAKFTVGDEELVAVGGQILVVPALVPHMFRTLGPFESIHIHASDHFITEWL